MALVDVLNFNKDKKGDEEMLELMSKRINTSAKGQKGLTLIELIIVMAIIGILAVIGITKLSGMTEAARVVADETTIREVESAAKLYFVAEGLENLEGEVDEDHPLINRDYLEEVPRLQSNKYDGPDQAISIVVNGSKVSTAPELDR